MAPLLLPGNGCIHPNADGGMNEERKVLIKHGREVTEALTTMLPKWSNWNFSAPHIRRKEWHHASAKTWRQEFVDWYDVARVIWDTAGWLSSLENNREEWLYTRPPT